MAHEDRGNKAHIPPMPQDQRTHKEPYMRLWGNVVIGHYLATNINILPQTTASWLWLVIGILLGTFVRGKF